MQKSKFKKIVDFLNHAFISSILTLFYFLIIGFSFLIYKVARLFHKKENYNSYWIDEAEKEEKIESFNSPF